MNRPYRDDEQAQVRRVIKDLMNCVEGVRDGKLPFARCSLWKAYEAFDELEDMVVAFESDTKRLRRRHEYCG